MMFHRAGRVKDRQWRFGFRLERVVSAAVVQIVTKTGNQKPENLQIGHELFHLAGLQHRKHRLRDI